jgi:Trypsin
MAGTARPRVRAHIHVCAVVALIPALLLPAGPASAVVKGTFSTLGPHVVRIHAGHVCTGVAIARRVIVTARHCVRGGMRVVAGRVAIGVAGTGQRGTLDDGRQVSVTGDAAIVRLTAPLPASVVPVKVGEGGGDEYTIAGYGTANEASRGAVGTLREAKLVAAEPRALVDPNRTGSIGASACFGDSGGPVLRGGALIGIITRAAHPHPRIACGHLTRWAPVVASEAATTATAPSAESGTPVEEPRPVKRRATKRAVAGSVEIVGYDPARLH